MLLMHASLLKQAWHYLHRSAGNQLHAQLSALYSTNPSVQISTSWWHSITSSDGRPQHQSQSACTGLFGLPDLCKPKDFARLMNDTRSRCDELLSQILSSPPGVQVVQLMDEMSDTLCRCYDAAEACRNVHGDPAWRQAATHVCYHLGAYISEVNHHHGMYVALKTALETAPAQLSYRHGSNHGASQGPPESGIKGSSSSSMARPVTAGWCAESVRVGQQLVLDMEKAGIHLPRQQRIRMQELMNANNHYAARFNQALRDPHELGTVNVRGSPAVLDASTVASIMVTEHDEDTRRQSRDVHALLGIYGLPEQRQQTVSAHMPIKHMLTLATHSRHKRLRKREHGVQHRATVWHVASRSPASNLHLLQQMITARHEQASLVGAPSYSRYKAQGSSLAEQPAAIVWFLQQLAQHVKQVADKEVQELSRLKAQLCGTTPAGLANSVYTTASKYMVQPWDVEYLMSAARKRSDLGVPYSVLQHYTHLPSVLSGLGRLMHQVMGMTLHIRPVVPPEGWAQGVLCCDVHHQDLGHLGTVYMDLCSRHGKYPSAVTFPIRCGRQLPNGSYQAPVMALLANFGPPGAQPHDVRLTTHELRTLLHEWGHCTHAMASHTRYQHLSGTRCAQDLVELPSHLFEHWVQDARALRLLLIDSASGEPLPQDACKALAAHRNMFPGLDLQQQVLLSLADQQLFGETPPQPRSDGCITTSDAWRDATQPYASLPWVEGSHPEARMGHLTIYGATYYSYVYARCLSTTVWSKLLADDPLNPEAGAAVLRGLLQPGGALPPVDLVTGLLGPHALQQHVGSGGWAPATTPHLISAALSVFA